MLNRYETISSMDFLRRSWFLILFIGGVIYWVGQQSVSISGIATANDRITRIENRANLLESTIGKLELKIDTIKEDVTLIKAAVIK